MKANDLKFSKKELKNETKFLKTLLNVLRFYNMFKPEKVKTMESKNVLDQWITQRVDILLKTVSNGLKNYNLNVVRNIPQFINDLSTWYIRRSRDRIKSGDMACFSTIKNTLLKLAKIMAPFMPFSADYLYKNLNGKKESVHLEDWPEYGNFDDKLTNQMDLIRQVCEIGHNLRKKAGIKVRQPLSILAVSKLQFKDELKNLIKDELNIEEIIVKDKLPQGKNWLKNENKNLLVALNKKITPALEKKGMVRDITRRINGLRKKAKLTPDNRVLVFYKTGDHLKEVIESFQKELEKNTKSEFKTKQPKSKKLAEKTFKIHGHDIDLKLYKY